MKKTYFIIPMLISLLFCACGYEPPLETTASTDQNTAPTEQSTESTEPMPGWVEVDGNHMYYLADGSYATGWMELDGSTYYFGEDGSAVTGEAVIDGKTHHFTAKGQKILLVNPWHAVPEGYQPDLVTLDSKISSKEIQVERSCYDALNAMIAECNLQCPTVCVISGYRTNSYQEGLYNKKVNYYLEQGYSSGDAKIAAAKVVAVPGTSEHQLGLAVDIIDTRSWSLTDVQETLPAQQWLMENSWRFGFILRYPKGTTDVTGIIYEPWHYRYVGVELAKELYEFDLTLEEYIAQHTKTQP